MSVFDEILSKINEISNSYVSSLNNELQAKFDALDKFEEEYKHARGKRETTQKNKNLMTTLQSINEDEDEPSKNIRKSAEAPEEKKRLSNKRSKQEVEGLLSPEQEKRQKRNASVRAQNNITKQVNTNLTQKLRRDDSTEKSSRRRKDVDKENTEPLPMVQIKLEKISLPPEPMELEAALDIQVKQEKNKDDFSMPPPAAPPKPRKMVQKDKSTDSEDEQTGKRRTRTRKPTETVPPPAEGATAASRATRASRRATRQTDDAPAPPEPRPKRTRAKKKVSESSTAEENAPLQNGIGSPAEKPRPKRTRRAQKAAYTYSSTTSSVESLIFTGVGRTWICGGSTEVIKHCTEVHHGLNHDYYVDHKSKASEVLAVYVDADQMYEKGYAGVVASKSEKEEKSKESTVEPEIVPKEESITENKSPAIPQKTVKKTKNDITAISDISMDPKPQATKSKVQESLQETQVVIEPKSDKVKSKMQEASLEATQVTCPMNTTVTISMDKSAVLTNGVIDHTDGHNTNNMNETLVIDKMNRETMVLDRPLTVMNSTVVLEKGSAQKDGTPNIMDDMSLLTDDSDHPEYGTPQQPQQPPEPTSAVKAKVQQFEEMAARTTRTKTRAMAKKDAETDNCTPPDKISKQVLSMDTLTKMNNMIFNGKIAQVSVSATKPTAKLPPTKTVPSSASKLSALNKAREEYESCSKDDARKKKEAMLEAKKEQQRRKREEKMAAAAAARELAEKERQVAMQAARKERMEKQAHADQGKLVRLKEVEKKKQELARKVAETEERRRAEEQARHARLAEEQKRADAARKKQIEESEAMKKEAALMAKEIEKRQKEYLEKQKMKQKLEDKLHTPLKSKGTPCGKAPPMEPVYMMDGFQYLNSDEDSDDDAPRSRPKIPCPSWATPKAQQRLLCIQQQLAPAAVDRLFSVRVHSPDLRAIFPSLERRALARTSSAVWRTPPAIHLSMVKESPV